MYLSVLKHKYSAIIKVIGAILLISIFSCRPFFAPGDEPKPKSFSYYGKFNPNVAGNVYPRPDGIYIYVDSSNAITNDSTIRYSIRVIKFFDSGLLIIQPIIAEFDSIAKRPYKRETAGNVFGYYIVKSDSIFFSTMVFYDHTEKFYSGKIVDNSIYLSANDNTNIIKENKIVKYSFIRTGE